MFLCFSREKPQFPNKYEVFLSFKGEDVRTNFISHLHAAMVRENISTFKDDCETLKGMDMRLFLFQAIEHSRISVVTFSRGYASSVWCLDELVKIMQCKESKGMIVIPVFHGVEPYEVRYQTGSFKEAFVKHEKEFGHEIVQRWRMAMTSMAYLSGYNLSNARNEAELVAQIIDCISKRLSQTVPRAIWRQIKKLGNNNL